MKPVYLFSLLIMGITLFGCIRTPVTVEWEQAMESYSAGQYQVACQQFEQLATAVPKDADLWFKMGNACARAKYPEKAVAAYQNAVLRNPKMEKAWYNMGVVQLQAALKTFIDMGRYANPQSAVTQEGQRLQEGILKLLKGNDGEKAQL